MLIKSFIRKTEQKKKTTKKGDLLGKTEKQTNRTKRRSSFHRFVPCDRRAAKSRVNGRINKKKKKEQR